MTTNNRTTKKAAGKTTAKRKSTKAKGSKTRAAAVKLPSSAGKSLVIVESPAKARTIGKFLGTGFRVEASIGHVRDLPQGAKQIPAKYKGEPWSNLGVNVNDNFTPIYVIPPGKTKQIKFLKDRLKESNALYLATDEDREGEAISWHLLEILKPKVPVHRLVFHEITKEAIQEALAGPREVDEGLVRAQETRRILDRLFGYEVSPLLWRKVRPKLSAGRVQSVAVRLIVERERERMAFVSGTWWDLLGTFTKESGQSLEATLNSVSDKKIPSGAGLGGGSGNAAGVLMGLNVLWNLKLSREKLTHLAAKLGADVPFFLTAPSALGKGRGDEVAPVQAVGKFDILLVYPGFPIATSWVYQNLNLKLTNPQNNISILKKFLSESQVGKLGKCLYNDLEPIVIQRYPEIQAIKEDLFNLGAKGSLLSGSGSTVFAIFDNPNCAKSAYTNLNKGNWEVFLTETVTCFSEFWPDEMLNYS